MKCIYHAYISHASRYIVSTRKGFVSVSSRTLEGLVSVSSRTVWQTSRSRLGSSGLGLGLCLDPEGLGPIPGIYRSRALMYKAFDVDRPLELADR